MKRAAQIHTAACVVAFVTLALVLSWFVVPHEIPVVVAIPIGQMLLVVLSLALILDWRAQAQARER